MPRFEQEGVVLNVGDVFLLMLVKSIHNHLFASDQTIVGDVLGAQHPGL